MVMESGLPIGHLNFTILNRTCLIISRARRNTPIFDKYLHYITFFGVYIHPLRGASCNAKGFPEMSMLLIKTHTYLILSKVVTPLVDEMIGW